MAKFQKKHVFVEAITFEELIAYGLQVKGAHIVEGVPWAFKYNGQVITHEDDDSYIIPVLGGHMTFRRGNFLITEDSGLMYVKEEDMFNMAYVPV